MTHPVDPPETIVLHQRPDGVMITQRGYDTTPYEYTLVGEKWLKPGLVNENDYSALDLRRSQKPVEAENDEHNLNHLDDAEGR